MRTPRPATPDIVAYNRWWKSRLQTRLSTRDGNGHIWQGLSGLTLPGLLMLSLASM